MQTETRNLKCIVEDEEINDIAKDMSLKIQERIETEAEKKATNKMYNDKIKTLQRVIDHDASVINDGFEYRDIECEVQMNHPIAGTKTVTRKDTGKSWEEGMTDEEWNLFAESGRALPA